jgi:hypothetical protein
MKEETKAGVVRGAHRTALTLAVGAALCLLSSLALAQHPAAPHPAMGARMGGYRAQPNRNQARPQGRPQPTQQFRGATPQAGGYRPGAQGAPGTVRPAMPGGMTYQGQGYARPAYPGANGLGANRMGANGPYGPPGHLGSWLNAHRGVPAQDQERMLHNDPTFNHLPEQQQQRLVQQLNRVDQMPEAQRERRLARAENIERLSPQQRAQLQDSGRRYNALPPDRQAAMKSAFRDLRAVPPDQRETVLNSARYQNAFSPDERGILSNMLSVEPYQPPH